MEILFLVVATILTFQSLRMAYLGIKKLKVYYSSTGEVPVLARSKGMLLLCGGIVVACLCVWYLYHSFTPEGAITITPSRPLEIMGVVVSSAITLRSLYGVYIGIKNVRIYFKHDNKEEVKGNLYGGLILFFGGILFAIIWGRFIYLFFHPGYEYTLFPLF